jgi:predicted ribosome quality control (RQC) complex YloA/Tae2 family protein
LPKKQKEKAERKDSVREIKRQRAQEAYQIQRKVEAERKPRKWSKRKLIFGFAFLVIGIIIIAYTLVG